MGTRFLALLEFSMVNFWLSRIFLYIFWALKFFLRTIFGFQEIFVSGMHIGLSKIFLGNFLTF